MEDIKIVELLKKREEKAIYALDKKYGKKLYYRAKYILNNKEDAEECVSDCYYLIWEHASNIQHNGALYAYAYSIVSNVAHSKNEKKHIDCVDYEVDEKWLRNPKDPIEDAIDTMTINNIVADILQDSSLINKQIIIKRYRNDKSIRTVAAELGLSEASVKMYCYRFKQKVLNILKKNGFWVSKKNPFIKHVPQKSMR